MPYTQAMLWHDYTEEHCRPLGQDVRRVMYVAKHFLSFFTPDCRVKRIDRERCREYRKHRLAAGVMESTVRRELVLLRAALSHAVKEDRLKSVPYIEMPPAGHPRERYLEMDEVRRVWLEVEKAHPRIRMVMWLALCTWARAGAIEELTVGRVDLFFSRAVDYRVPGRRVTKKRRSVVAISDELWPVLYEQIYRYGPPWKNDRVVPPGPRGRFSTTYHGCKDVLRAAGIDERFVCRHVFRKTGPSHAAQAGESLDFIAEVLADDVGTTKRNYAKYKPERLVSTVSRGWFAGGAADAHHSQAAGVGAARDRPCDVPAMRP